MTSPYPTEVLVAGHSTDLRQEAAAVRLALLARCCRPSTWARLVRRTSTAARKALRGPRRQPVNPTPCCAAA